MTNQSNAKPGKKRRERLILLTVILFIVAATIIIALDWNDIRQVLVKANWGMSVVAQLLILVAYFFMSLGYVLVNRAFSVKIGWSRLFAVGFVSAALNNILDFMGAAGHSLRLMLTRHYDAPPGGILAASIFHSYLSNVMMLALPVTGLLYLLMTGVVSGTTAMVFSIMTGLLCFALVMATAILLLRPLRKLVLRIIWNVWHFITHRSIAGFLTDLDNSLTSGIAAFTRSNTALVGILIVMAADWVFVAAGFWFCFQALGYSPKLSVLLAGFGIGISAGNASMIPGGLGVQEASLAGVYAVLGVPFAQAVLASMLFRVVFDFIPFFISLTAYGKLMRRQK